MGLHNEDLCGPTGPLCRIWAGSCDSPTEFSSIASATPGIGFARIGGTTTVHLRGPLTAARTLSCPADSEYFGVDFRIGAHLTTFPRAGLVNSEIVLPTLPDGRILLDGHAWELPTPQNVDVFVDRLARCGLLVVDPLVEDLGHGEVPRGMPERTAQGRFLRAVGISRRTLAVIERARTAARRLRAGASIADVVDAGGFHDQPHLTRTLRRMIGHTPAQLDRGGMFLDL
ncbi:helix-turn-helix domain-containing protein [Pseudonocardia sp. CA-107938]|uniref:helix-turn-helix domain-containing protein n=1 Tax=Pseudonocardia sp. CA-107938 TaxID=3240021 RepID=UPI003D8E38F3